MLRADSDVHEKFLWKRLGRQVDECLFIRTLEPAVFRLRHGDVVWYRTETPSVFCTVVMGALFNDL